MHCQFYLAIFIVVLMAINLNCVSAKLAESEEIDNYYKKIERRSPYLRLDELATKIYLAKNKLGGGYIDPLEIGKRSMSSFLDNKENEEMIKAIKLYELIKDCIKSTECAQSLEIVSGFSKNTNEIED